MFTVDFHVNGMYQCNGNELRVSYFCAVKYNVIVVAVDEET